MEILQRVHCPACGSNSTEHLAAIGVVVAIAGSSCAIWVPMIGWAMLPFLLIYGLYLIAKGGRRCNNCKHMFQPK